MACLCLDGNEFFGFHNASELVSELIGTVKQFLETRNRDVTVAICKSTNMFKKLKDILWLYRYTDYCSRKSHSFKYWKSQDEM